MKTTFNNDLALAAEAILRERKDADPADAILYPAPELREAKRPMARVKLGPNHPPITSTAVWVGPGGKEIPDDPRYWDSRKTYDAGGGRRVTVPPRPQDEFDPADFRQTGEDDGAFRFTNSHGRKMTVPKESTMRESKPYRPRSNSAKVETVPYNDTDLTVITFRNPPDPIHVLAARNVCDATVEESGNTLKLYHGVAISVQRTVNIAVALYMYGCDVVGVMIHGKPKAVDFDRYDRVVDMSLNYWSPYILSCMGWKASDRFTSEAEMKTNHIVMSERSDVADARRRIDEAIARGERVVVHVQHPTMARVVKEYAQDQRVVLVKEFKLKEGGGLYDAIQNGDRVTIVNRFGQESTGKAVMLGPAGWVLNMGGRHGTPAIATPDNVTRVTPGKRDRNSQVAGALLNRRPWESARKPIGESTFRGTTRSQLREFGDEAYALGAKAAKAGWIGSDVRSEMVDILDVTDDPNDMVQEWRAGWEQTDEFQLKYARQLQALSVPGEDMGDDRLEGYLDLVDRFWEGLIGELTRHGQNPYKIAQSVARGEKI